MKRRDILKGLIVAPVIGLLPKEQVSGCPSSPSSSVEATPPFEIEQQFMDLDSRIVSVTKFEDKLVIATERSIYFINHTDEWLDSISYT